MKIKEQYKYIFERTAGQKAKDYEIAILQDKLHKIKQKKEHRHFVLKMTIILLGGYLLCLMLSILFASYVFQITKQPQNCKYYTLDIMWDFKARCEVCKDGFFRKQNQFDCS